ncbi:MAG: septum formation initiator family protein [Deltaproteobacteria bacterium]|nr:septum formation initiator family protein [Deltaproteobacteria bacterium]
MSCRFTITAMRHLSDGLRPKWLTLILGILLVALAFDAMLGPSSPRDLLVLRRHGSRLESERDRLRLDNAAVREQIAQLKSDDTYLQQLIRQDLGYVRPGELVYRFPKPERP